ncbi:hypothetical protein SKAU_G00408440 [Synaphobranchus kaupii]|uniref:RING-type domain-containing protein n=1 Tax=Synaphobranchus kaupii TaxID=118154 RepID=A0A9Q1IC93_SYNKA|nr:hypothetical protein SKAU_G00408440 [Synaphobranchus kaupii]
MRDVGMELLRRIFSSIGFDCLKRAPSSTPSSPVKAVECDPPHCQCCIEFDVRLKRLSCGHLFCDRCTDRIINRAFRDIEGLSDYPCPMCKSITRLSGSAGALPTELSLSRTPGDASPVSPLQKQVIREEEEEDEGVPGDGGGTGVLSCVERPEPGLVTVAHTRPGYLLKGGGDVHVTCEVWGWGARTGMVFQSHCEALQKCQIGPYNTERLLLFLDLHRQLVQKGNWWEET